MKISRSYYIPKLKTLELHRLGLKRQNIPPKASFFPAWPGPGYYCTDKERFSCAFKNKKKDIRLVSVQLGNVENRESVLHWSLLAVFPFLPAFLILRRMCGWSVPHQRDCIVLGCEGK